MDEIGNFRTELFRTEERSGFTSKGSIDLIYPTLNGHHLNEYRLFTFLYGTIPHKISETKIEVENARLWFLDKYPHLITNTFYNERCFGQNKTAKKDDCLYTLNPDLLVYFDTQQHIVRYLFRKTDEAFVRKLVDELNMFKEPITEEAKIYLLVFKGDYFDVEKFKLKEPEFNISDNYNDDFSPIHNLIHKRLNKENDKGIVLLHGEPGTGKTSYIRYLTSVLKKKVIFFPPNLADNITHPNLISLLIENPNSILIIEDAENILLDRNFNDRSAVSALLNLSDGLLSDCLNIQLICTFNTDLAKIDSALLRKGRLIASYKFDLLAREKAQVLSEKLGFTNYIVEPMRLTDIYNQQEIQQTAETKRHIGFKLN